MFGKEKEPLRLFVSIFDRAFFRLTRIAVFPLQVFENDHNIISNREIRYER
jgi:hypothetical protein